MNKKCQVFTPSDIVVELLDKVGYITNLYGKKVIENACGDGNILGEIVRRYIKDCINNDMSLEKIKTGLESDIFGAEIDKIHYMKCIENLNTITEEYNICNIKWKILNVDILKEKLNLRFDYIIGNPPYITYRELENETRIFVKENYESCTKGKFDYCYAFIEWSIKYLNHTGKIAYLIPNSIFKNVFAQKLRDIMLPHLAEIYDYTTRKLFTNALTSSAIIIIDKENKNDKIKYHDIVNNRLHKLDKTDLTGKWMFSQLSERNPKDKIRFGNYFTAAITIATLLNEAYILKDFIEEEEYVAVGTYKIERSLTRSAVSPRSLNYNKSERILFPYKYDNNKLIRYTKREFEENFPEATRHLMSYSEKLKARKSDNSIEWFEYGRSQALAHLDQPKLLISTVITKEVKVFEIDKECIPYSGIYIVPKKYISLEKAKEILESEEFYLYIKGIGINASGSSLRITAVDVNNYMFSNSLIHTDKIGNNNK